MSNEDPETHIVTYEGLHLHFAYPYLHFNGTHPRTQGMGQERLGLAHESPITNGPSPILQVGRIRAQGLLEDVVPIEILNPTLAAPNLH